MKSDPQLLLETRLVFETRLLLEEIRYLQMSLGNGIITHNSLRHVSLTYKSKDEYLLCG